MNIYTKIEIAQKIKIFYLKISILLLVLDYQVLKEQVVLYAEFLIRFLNLLFFAKLTS